MSFPIEALSMEEGSSGNVATSQEALPWQHILDKMADPELDAFQRMKIALYELLPAITEDKESDLKDLAHTLESVVDIEELMEETQSIFNELKDSPKSDPALGNQYLENLRKLRDAIEVAGSDVANPETGTPGIIDADLSDQLVQEVQGMIDRIEEGMQSGLNATEVVQIMWYSENYTSGNYGPWYTEDNIQALKQQLDGFNDVGAGISGMSSSLQNELQFEIANYQQFMGIQDEMYREDMAMTKAHVSKQAPR